MGFKVLHILALEYSNFLDFFLNAIRDGLNCLKKKILRAKYFFWFFGFKVKGPRQFFYLFFKNCPKNGTKIFKKWYKGCFLEVLKIIIYLDMLFMDF